MVRNGIQAWAAIGVAWLAFATTQSFAQGWNDQPPSAPPAAVSESDQPIDPNAVSGPTIYVADNFAQLARINLGTGAVHIIGRLGTVLTDIAFQPGTHALYGVSFSSFYRIDKATAATRLVGSLGLSDANALVFNSKGVAYSAGFRTGDLYTVDVRTGAASLVGSTRGYNSSGDLAFYNDHLVLSASRGEGSIPMYLVTLNESTGAHVGTAVGVPVSHLFGLVSTGKNELFGLADDGNDAGLYRLTPGAAKFSNRATLLEDLTNRGLGTQILGAAYDGNYQP